ncbi:MAG: hypothetical protein CL459_03765 [Acidimicrobiaceae bacterium]|nr:hypothetical protein [Acidimicrobiaceae bacterium]
MTDRPEAAPDRPTVPEDPSLAESTEPIPRSSASIAPGAAPVEAEPPAAGPATTGVRLERLFEGTTDDEPMVAHTAPAPTAPAPEAETPRRGPSAARFSPLGRGRTMSERTPREPRRGYRVRRVRRLLRHVEPWSVLKIGLVFYLCVWGMTVIASQALWRTAETAGIIEKVERFIEELFALETFAFDTDKIFRLYVLAGLVLVIGGTALTVVLVVLFNLISDLMGGIRFTMIEEETAVRRRRVRMGEDVVPAGKVGRRRRSSGDEPTDSGG